jgi:putative membrane protein (TIGR04086 family)
MGNTRYVKTIFKGVMISIILTMFLLLLLSLIMMKFELSESNYNLAFGVITTISLSIGAVIASKFNERKGYLTGLLVGLTVYIFIFFLTSIINGGIALSIKDVYSLLISLFVGTISGILGVNL